MSDPQPSRSELPIVPALVVSSLLGGLIALGLSSVWRFAMPGAANPPERPAAASAVALPPSGPAEFVEFLPPLTPQEQRIEEALEKPAECDFRDIPLTDAVAIFAKKASIKMVIDHEALQEEGIATDTPVTRELSGVRLRSVLNRILDRLQLTVIPKHDFLLVTTLAKEKETVFTRTYPVSDLCRVPESGMWDFQSLIILIEQETSGPWLSSGESTLIQELGSTGSLSIRQSYKVHREILELLRSLRAAQKSNLLNASKSDLQKWDEQRAAAAATLLKRPTTPVEFVDVIDTTQSEAERFIEKALDKNVNISFQNTPLTEVVAFFAKQLSINAVLDHEALTEEGIATDTPISLQLNQIKAGSALTLLLRPHNLRATIENEALVVTTTQKEKDKLVSLTYPVSDLIGPAKDYASLIEMLQSTTSGPWMNRSGHGGNVTESATAGCLVVRQPLSVQREVLIVLRQLREAQQRMLPMKPGKALPSRR